MNWRWKCKEKAQLEQGVEAKNLGQGHTSLFGVNFFLLSSICKS